MKKLLVVIFLLAILPVISVAQTEVRVDKSVKIYFRQNSSVIDEGYMGNKATLKKIALELKAYCADSTANFSKVRVIGSASPEGSLATNSRLSKDRAQAIAEWFSREVSVKLGYEVINTFVDWDGLLAMVEANSDVPYRSEVLNILKNVPVRVMREDGLIYSDRYDQLFALRGGEPYRYLEEKFFPHLRYADASVEFWWIPKPGILEITGDKVLSLGADGGQGSVPFKKNKQDGVVPTVATAATWITALTPTESGLSFNVEPNMSREPRTADIEVSCYDSKHKVVVNQAGREPQLDITSASPMNFPAEGGDGAITFKHNVVEKSTPAVKEQADWLKLGEPTPDSVALTVAPNNNKKSRSTNVSVECYGKQYDVVVNQDAVAQRPFYMAIKTIMLYDVAAIPNVGVEFHLGKRFSLAANYTHAWWSNSSKNFFWRYYGADASFRWWFGKASKVKPLQGHHVGVNYLIYTFDFQLGNRGYLGGKPGGMLINRPNHTVSLEYGYSLPIARRLNLDFVIGVGYSSNTIDEYMPIDGHFVWQRTNAFKYFGPTKAEVSLVWLIGNGNFNEKFNKKGKEAKR